MNNESATSKHKEEAVSNLAELIQSQSKDDINAAAADLRLTEDLALSLLERPELQPSALEALAGNASVMGNRKVLVALVSHPRTPRHVSLPIARRLYTFELMRIVLLPGVPADLKLAIEQTIVARLETVSAGERLTLAKQGSTQVAAALLNDPETRVMQAALNNPRLTEASVVRALMRPDVSSALVQAVGTHSRWSLRKEVQLALLRNEHTPLARALQFSRTIPVRVLKEILQDSRLTDRIRNYLAQELDRRKR